MLNYYQEFETQKTIAINPKYIVAIFMVKTEDGKEFVNINTSTGNIAVEGELFDIIGNLKVTL